MRPVICAAGTLLFATAGFIVMAQAPALPGTSTDRVGFPTNYQQTFKRMYALDNNQNRQIRVIWANDVAQTTTPGQPWNFPYGSVLLFESWLPELNADGDPGSRRGWPLYSHHAPDYLRHAERAWFRHGVRSHPQR